MSDADIDFDIHLLYYVRLDDRAKDLRTTTSPTLALSDEYDNNSGLITAVNFLPCSDNISVKH